MPSELSDRDKTQEKLFVRLNANAFAKLVKQNLWMHTLMYYHHQIQHDVVFDSVDIFQYWKEIQR